MLSTGLVGCYWLVAPNMAYALPSVSTASSVKTEGSFAYRVQQGEAILTNYFGGDTELLLIPGTLGGFPVRTVGDGTQTAFSNNKTRSIVLFPDSVAKISKQAIYDYNVTYYFSLPASISEIEDGATSSIAQAVFVGEPGSEAERYAHQIGIDFSSNYVSLTIDGSDGGHILQAGSYLLPKTLEKAYTVSLLLIPDAGFKPGSVMLNGRQAPISLVDGHYAVAVTLPIAPQSNIKISASFVRDSTAPVAASQAATPLTGEVPDFGASAGKYANTLGLMGGAFHATRLDGTNGIFELVATYGSQDPARKFRTEDELKAYAKMQGLTFGVDYDYTHLYNYKDTSDTNRGTFPGGKQYYVAYLYKRHTGSTDNLDIKVSSLEDAMSADAGRHTLNTSGVFAQNSASIALKNPKIRSFSLYEGPTEGGNFFGGNSAVLADSHAIIDLDNAIIDGLANSVFATYGGKVFLKDGYIFASSTGAHGPYVAYGGQIHINMRDDVEPRLTARPDPAKAHIARNKATGNVEVTDTTDDGTAVVITADEASTALATDTGGGSIFANHVLSKTYGVRSAGVYSIGSNEGKVWVYNSTLISYLDAGLVSASGGYIYAKNSIIEGTAGIKTRAQQNSDTLSEVRVVNSRVSAYYDRDAMNKAYDVSEPATALTSDIAQGKHNFFELNMFADKANQWTFGKDSLSYWFADGYRTAPGFSGGNKMAVIYTDGSKTPIYVDSTRLENRNYQLYKNRPGSKAENLIVSAEGNGTANVFFLNENKQNRWDLTGESQETTEIVGDFNIAPPSTAGSGGMPPGMIMRLPGSEGGPPAPPGGFPPMPAGGFEGDNHLHARFENSEWEGTVVGVSQNATLTLDARSTWVITRSTAIDTLEVQVGTLLSARGPVTLTVYDLKAPPGFKPGKNVTLTTVARPKKAASAG